jgi:hypothetical protein
MSEQEEPVPAPDPEQPVEPPLPEEEQPDGEDETE